MAKKSGIKIDWRGNSGRCFPDPGTLKTAKWGICSRKMNVERNVLGATSWIESMGHGKHLHDRFTCPNLSEDWHKRIYRLKMDVYTEEYRDDVIGYEKMKKAAEKEIIKLLKTNAVR